MGFAALENRITAVGMKMLANVHVTRSIGPEFEAILDLAEPDVFDRARITTYTLRFPASIELAANDPLTIAAGDHAGNYKVTGSPQRINGSECLAEMVKV